MSKSTNEFFGLREIEFTPRDRAFVKQVIKRSKIILRNSRWTSSAGLKLNYWVSTEKLISDPSFLKFISGRLAKLISQSEIGAIAACSVSGIPWATSISSQYNIPLVILRKRNERHGEKSLIIGDPQSLKNRNILLVDDSILTGRTIKYFQKQLKRHGFTVHNIFVFDIWTNDKLRKDVENWARKAKSTIWYVTDFKLKI